MDLRQMEYMVALADEQHFTRAAALCGVSQSGLSAAIRGLETELGGELFSRTTRRVEPTDAGLALLPYARELLSQASAGRDAVVRVTRELSGQLRVGAEQCLGLVDVPALLERFHRRYPQVTIHFTQAGSYDLLDMVRAGELDAAFVASSTTSGRSTGLRSAADQSFSSVHPTIHWPPRPGRTGPTSRVWTMSTSTSRGRCVPSTTRCAGRMASTAGCAAR